FLPEIDNGVRLGVAKTSIARHKTPTIKSFGEKMGLDFRDFRVRNISFYRSAEDFWERVDASHPNSDEQNHWLLVHGFRSDFLSPTKTLTAIASDTRFLGPLFLFSWPSNKTKGSSLLKNYKLAQRNATSSAFVLAQSIYALGEVRKGKTTI